MSIVNLKIIFVKKQKQARERLTQGRGATFIITEMAVFTLETDYTCETGYPVLIGKWTSFNFEGAIRLTFADGIIRSR